LGDPLLRIACCIDFPALAAEVDRAAPHPVSPQCGRPPYPTVTMVRILVLKRLTIFPTSRWSTRCWIAIATSAFAV
jgi:hypothetical protein